MSFVRMYLMEGYGYRHFIVLSAVSQQHIIDRQIQLLEIVEVKLIALVCSESNFEQDALFGISVESILRFFV